MTIKPRSAVVKMQEYIPGEQPQTKNFIKLNTNENPYNPSPAVIDAITLFDFDRARKYPDPMCIELRTILAKRHSLDISQIICGNGSDEILRMLMECYVDKNETVAMLEPTYTLYVTLCQMREAQIIKFRATEPELPMAIAESNARLIFIANPNPPLGTFYKTNTIAEICKKAKNSLVVVDEAYIDFAKDNSMRLVNKFSNLVIVRTLSKSFSLAGVRVGFAFGNKEIIKNLYKIKDSYNLNAFSQTAAAEALKSENYADDKISEIISERELLRKELIEMGFTVPESSGNFLFIPCENAKLIYQTLKDRKILIRYLEFPKLIKGIRITIGLPEQNKKVIREIKKILKEKK